MNARSMVPAPHNNLMNHVTGVYDTYCRGYFYSRLLVMCFTSLEMEVMEQRVIDGLVLGIK